MSTSVPDLGLRRSAGVQHLVVGTFTHSSLHVLTLDTTEAEASFDVTANLPAQAKHFWLALDAYRDRLYSTSFTVEGADVAVDAYQIQRSKWQAAHIGRQIVASRSGYVALGPSYTSSKPAKVLYSAGGPVGEVYALDPDSGNFYSNEDGNSSIASTISGIPGAEARVQEIDFVHGGRISKAGQKLGPVPTSLQADNNSGQHTGELAFGGLRHGSHSIDVGPPGPTGLRPVYVADIGRNSTFIYTTPEGGDGSLTLAKRVHAPQDNDGPRHVWPHPNGRTVYVVEEHSNVVDVYQLHWNQDQLTKNDEFAGHETASNSLGLQHIQRLSLLPTGEPANKYWADEVRTSAVPDTKGTSPRWLFASTRGLESDTKGYVALYELDADGLVVGASRNTSNTQDDTFVDLYQTRTCGGWANAIEPCPWLIDDGKSGIYAALTDGEEGLVIVLTVEVLQDESASQGHLSVAGHLSGSVSGEVQGSLTGRMQGNTNMQELVDNRVQNDINRDGVHNRFKKQVDHREKGARARAKIVEVARTSLGKDDRDGKVRGAATAVWMA